MEKIENLEDKIKTEMETLKTKLSTIEEELRVVSNLDKLRSDAAEKRRLLEAEHLSLGARKTASLQNANSVQVSNLDYVFKVHTFHNGENDSYIRQSQL